MRQNLVGDATALIRYPDDYMLGRLADQHLDWRRLGTVILSLLDNGLDGVSDQLADDVLQVTLDVREGSIEMAFDTDVWELYVGAVCGLDQLLRRPSATLDDLFGVAFEEYFAHSVRVWVVLGLVVGKVPGSIEGVCQGQMLLGNDTARDALAGSTRLGTKQQKRSPYRSQHGVHEFVRLLRPHQAADLKHAEGQPGDDGGMLSQRLPQHLAVFLVVIEGTNLGDPAKALKGGEIELVDVGEMGVRNDDIGQGLDVTQAVGDSATASAQGRASRWEGGGIPRGQLQAAVIGAIEQAGLGEGAAEEGQTAQADGACLALDPSTRTCQPWGGPSAMVAGHTDRGPRTGATRAHLLRRRRHGTLCRGRAGARTGRGRASSSCSGVRASMGRCGWWSWP